MVRFLPLLRGMSGGMALTFLDLSTFTQFAAFDCILPGPADKLAYTRILLSAFGVPVLLFMVSASAIGIVHHVQQQRQYSTTMSSPE
jgi:hypothetical protein